MTRVVRAFGYSLQGLRHAWHEEASFRQEAVLALILIPIGIYLGHSGLERAALVSPVLLILIVETLNSAVEAVVDRSGLERHPLAGHGERHGIGRRTVEFRVVRNRLVAGLVRSRTPIETPK